MDSGGRRVRLGLLWPPEPRAGGRECGEQGAGRGCRLLLRTPTGPLDGPSHRPPPAASGRSARGHRGGGGEGEGRARPETHGRPDQAAPGWPRRLGLTRQRQRQLPRALSKETGSLRWGRPAGGTARLGPPPSTPRARREAPGRLTYEGFDCAVDVLVLLEAGGRGEGLAAVGAGVRPRPDVLGPDVPLQVAGVREHLGHRCRRPAPIHVPWPPDGSAGRSAPCPSPCCSGDPRGASESCRGSPRARSLPP